MAVASCQGFAHGMRAHLDPIAGSRIMSTGFRFDIPANRSGQILPRG
jgi:hypothetical protein